MFNVVHLPFLNKLVLKINGVQYWTKRLAENNIS